MKRTKLTIKSASVLLILAALCSMRVVTNIRAANHKAVAVESAAWYHATKAQDVADVKAMYQRLTGEQRREVWREKLKRALEIRGLTGDQDKFLRLVWEQLDQMDFVSGQQSPETAAVVKENLRTAAKLFTKPQSLYLFGSLGGQQPDFDFQKISMRLDQGGYCTCSTAEDFCPERCNGPGAPSCQGCVCGCGWLWSAYCDGKCGGF